MRSLRGQLTTANLLLFALLLAGGGVLVFWAVRDSLYDQFDAGLRVKALTVVTSTRQDDGEVEVSFSDRFLREFDDDVATDFFQVYDEDEKSAERSESLRGKDLPLRSGSLEAPEYWNLELPGGAPGRAIGVRFQPRFEDYRRDTRRKDPMEAVAIVASARGELDETIAELRNILLGSGLALLALTAVIVPFVLRRGLRPLDRMAEQAAHIDASSLQTRFSVEPLPTELQPIAGRLNDLLARLESSFERERRFSSDLAHELRTPLAELRSLAEVALKWPAERTAATDEAVLEISLHMEALVARLLALARAEDGRLALQTETVELAPLVEDTVAALAPRAAARQIEIERELADDPRVATDPVLLKSIVSNVLTNAVDYSPRGSRVRIALASDDSGREFRLSIANSAENLAREDVPQMFERLWRKDASRTGAEHTGLGLALSRSFAALLGLTLEAELRDDGVLVMTLRGLTRTAAPVTPA